MVWLDLKNSLTQLSASIFAHWLDLVSASAEESCTRKKGKIETELTSPELVTAESNSCCHGTGKDEARDVATLRSPLCVFVCVMVDDRIVCLASI